jgi:hypothetical protein
MNAFIKLLYALLIAGAVVTFVGFGIYSLYQPPKDIDYSNNYDYADDYNSPYQAQERQINQERDQHDKDLKTYYRNVTYIALASSVIFIGLGLLLYRKFDVFGEGLAFGGIATGIYAIESASNAEARILRFAAVTWLLLSALIITFRRFYGKSHRKV